MVNKFEIQQVMTLAAKFDTINYNGLVSGQFDSDAQYHKMKIDYIHEQMKDV